MKIAPATPLNVSLRWDNDDIQPVGRLAYRDQIAYLEFDQAFLRTGLELSPVHHKTIAGLQRPYDTKVFEGLHGIFNDSLPDGWGRLLLDRRARQLGIEPSTLTPIDRLACYPPKGIKWNQAKEFVHHDFQIFRTWFLFGGSITDARIKRRCKQHIIRGTGVMANIRV
jgi:hypothetical protein